MHSSMFISYSHEDQAWMHVVRKHLRGMLLDRCNVWTDEDIPAGSTWESKLLGVLNQAAAGLVLVSPDYLISPWCRRELSALYRAHRQGRLVGLYWIALRPCGWQWSELAELQAVQEPAGGTLEDGPAGPERDARALRACLRIADDLRRYTAGENPDFVHVRELLAGDDQTADVQPQSEVRSGDFSLYCQGRRGDGSLVFVKVLTNTPLRNLRQLFLTVSLARREVEDPSVVKIDKVFAAGPERDRRIVIVSELAPPKTLATLIDEDAARPPAERLLTPGYVALVLQRLAAALAQLHALPPIDDPTMGGAGYTHAMGPMSPQNVFFDERGKRPQLSLVGVTNFLWRVFDAPTFRRIVNPHDGAYAVPASFDAAGPEGGTPDVDKAQADDQYFLGRLALELLQGQLVFTTTDSSQVRDPIAYLRDCDNDPHARWTRHRQLVQLLRKLLNPDPSKRYPSMNDVVVALRALEEPERMLAKYSFRRCVLDLPDDAPALPAGDTPTTAPGLAFSRAFYERFFAADANARDVFRRHLGAAPGLPDAELVATAHHEKLIASLKAVLNYRPGNDPSAIDALLPAHYNKGIARGDFEAFENAFIETLAARVAGRDDAEEIIAAWKTLFRPVTDEMRTKLRLARSVERGVASG